MAFCAAVDRDSFADRLPSQTGRNNNWNAKGDSSANFGFSYDDDAFQTVDTKVAVRQQVSAFDPLLLLEPLQNNAP